MTIDEQEAPAAELQGFAALGLSELTLRALAELGYEEPTPIQKQTIARLASGADVIAQAQTGTGKTAAFALPIIEQIDPAIRTPQAIVLAPTRELAVQVAEAFHTYGKHHGVSVLPEIIDLTFQPNELKMVVIKLSRLCSLPFVHVCKSHLLQLCFIDRKDGWVGRSGGISIIGKTNNGFNKLVDIPLVGLLIYPN